MTLYDYIIIVIVVIVIYHTLHCVPFHSTTLHYITLHCIHTVAYNTFILRSGVYLDATKACSATCQGGERWHHRHPVVEACGEHPKWLSGNHFTVDLGPRRTSRFSRVRYVGIKPGHRNSIKTCDIL